MQFQVPQFIEMEDKIFGPFTFKQFVYVLGGMGSAFLFYTLFHPVVAILLIVPFSGTAFALAFYKVNGRPFSAVLESGTKYFLSSKLYLWRKEKKKTSKLTKIALSPESKLTANIPKISEGRLNDMSWQLDVKTEDEDRPLGRI